MNHRPLTFLLARLFKNLDIRDVFAFIGLILLVAGLAQLSIAAALIVPGTFFLLVAVWPSIRPSRRQ